jgi:hypothetical protein
VVDFPLLALCKTENCWGFGKSYKRKDLSSTPLSMIGLKYGLLEGDRFFY